MREIHDLRLRPDPSPAEAVRLFQKFLRTIYLQVISRNEAVYVGRLLIPEQLAPTTGFEILYNKAFKDLHEAVCFLVALVREEPAHIAPPRYRGQARTH